MKVEKVVATTVESIPKEAIDIPADTPVVDTPAIDTPAVDTTDTPADTPAVDTPADIPAEDMVPAKRLGVYVKRAKTAEEQLAKYKAKYGEVVETSDNGEELGKIFSDGKKNDNISLPPLGNEDEVFLQEFTSSPKKAMQKFIETHLSTTLTPQLDYEKTVDKLETYYEKSPDLKKTFKTFKEMDNAIASAIASEGFNKVYAPSKAIKLGLELALSRKGKNIEVKPEIDNKLVDSQNPQVVGRGNAPSNISLTNEQKSICKKYGWKEEDYLNELKRGGV